jgi:hypothetical protein
MDLQVLWNDRGSRVALIEITDGVVGAPQPNRMDEARGSSRALRLGA